MADDELTHNHEAINSRPGSAVGPAVSMWTGRIKFGIASPLGYAAALVIQDPMNGSDCQEKGC